MNELSQRDLDLETIQSRLDKTVLENAQVAMHRLEIEDLKEKLENEKESVNEKVRVVERDFNVWLHEVEEGLKSKLSTTTTQLEKREVEVADLQSMSEV